MAIPKPVPGNDQPCSPGRKLFNLYIDPNEEHAMAPRKQPIVPLLLPELARHVKKLQAFKPKVAPRGLDSLSGELSK